jgi:hypothetical protein
MRKEKNVIGLLRALSTLLADEHATNPAFARKLDMLLAGPPGRRRPPKKDATVQENEHLPDIHAEWNNRGEIDFRLWLRYLPVPVLRELIRSEDLDATRRTSKWHEAEKLAEYIADNLRARQSRGSAFIGERT